MPNWCTGNIRFYGLRDNVIKCLNGIFQFNMYDAGFHIVTEPAIVDIDDDGCVTLSTPFSDERSWCSIKGTRRNFLSLFGRSYEVTSDCSYGLDHDITETEAVVVFSDFRAAWNIDMEPYIDISKEYHVGIKILGWEQGVMFSQEIEVNDGEVLIDKCKSYQNAMDWMINTELPYYGG
ncbi:hypothetical protein [Pseudobutyrivibrio sp.]